MKTHELVRLREETTEEVTALDSYRAKLKATENRIGAKRPELAAREASSGEAASRLQETLVAILAQEKRMDEEIAYFSGIHERHLTNAREAHEKQLAAQAETIRAEVSREFDEVLEAKIEEYDNALEKQEEYRLVYVETIRRLGGLLTEAHEKIATLERGRDNKAAELRTAAD